MSSYCHTLAALLAYLTLLSSSTGLAQSQCTTGLPSLDTIHTHAVFIGGIISRDIYQTLVPTISFTCSGTLTQWTIVASTVGGGSRFPELQIWRNDVGNTYAISASSEITESHSTSTPHVYEYRPDPPLQFQAGDALGVFTPPVPRLTFKFQNHGGPKNYYIGGIAFPKESFSLDGATVLDNRNDYPLVSVEVDPPSCASGFIDKTTLLLKAGILNDNTSDVTYREATQRIVPGISFLCPGVVLNFTLAALKYDVSPTRRSYPEVQIWRRVDDVEWTKVAAVSGDAAVVTTKHLNVYNYVPIPGLPFQPGDILGVYQPYSSATLLKFYLEANTGPENYYYRDQAAPFDHFRTDGGLVHTENHLPLLAVDISTSTSAALPTPVPTPGIPDSSVSPAVVMPRGGGVTGYVAGIVMCLLLLVVTLTAITMQVLGKWRHKTEKGQWGATPEAPSVNTGGSVATAHDRSMEYNPMYRARNPSQIISKGQRYMLNIHTNVAYGNSENPAEGRGQECGREELEHTYESIT